MGPRDRPKLDGSYSYCERIAKLSGSNFYRSFSLLRQDRHRAMLALYAFARLADDAADESFHSHWPESRWHHWVDELTNNHADSNNNLNRELGLIRPALVDAIHRFHIPVETLHEIINGVAMDMVTPVRFAEWEQVQTYCERVASSVGVACLSIWSDTQPLAQDASAKRAARDCGIAFQLTNILRDLAEDAARDRIYLPSSELGRFHIDPIRWLQTTRNSNAFRLNEMGDWRGLLRLQFERAHAFYASGWNVSRFISADGLRMFSLMWHTYRQMLHKLERNPVAIWQRRVGVSKWDKLRLFASHAFTPYFSRCIAPQTRTTSSQSQQPVVSMAAARTWPDNGPAVAVIGGGLAGMSAAMHLARHGCRVTLFESKSRLGGRVGSFMDASGQWIDYCQHVSMRCCEAFGQWIDDTGQRPFWTEQSKLHFVSQKGRTISVSAWPLPAPLHLAGLLLHWPQLGVIDRFRVGIGLRRLLKLRSTDINPNMLAVDWLRVNGQTERCIQNFWATILVSALGEQVSRVTLSATRKVLVDGFANQRHAFHLLVPNRPLSHLILDCAVPTLSQMGVTLELNTAIKHVSQLASGGIEVFTARTSVQNNDRSSDLELNSRRTYDAVISAVPWSKLNVMMSDSNCSELIAPANQLESSPITGIHTWWDRAWLEAPHAILIDRLCQWVFPAPQSESATDAAPANPNLSQEYYYQIVISGSRDIPKGDSEALLKMVKQDLADVFPAAAVATLLRGKVVTDPNAVFSVSPGHHDARLNVSTLEANGIWLAGDWCQTGWPATMEGATLSGGQAAAALLRAFQRPAQIVR
jgi:squalene-associated FAD-dependent desaturase